MSDREQLIDLLNPIVGIDYCAAREGAERIVRAGWRPPAHGIESAGAGAVMPEVDRIGKNCADTVFMSDQSHPKGYILSDSVRVRRALRAYQWAMARKESWTEGGYVHLPSNATVLAAMREWENADDR